MLDTDFNHMWRAVTKGCWAGWASWSESSFIESGAGKSKDWKENEFEEAML